MAVYKSVERKRQKLSSDSEDESPAESIGNERQSQSTRKSSNPSHPADLKNRVLMLTSRGVAYRLVLVAHYPLRASHTDHSMATVTDIFLPISTPSYPTALKTQNWIRNPTTNTTHLSMPLQSSTLVITYSSSRRENTAKISTFGWAVRQMARP